VYARRHWQDEFFGPCPSLCLLCIFNGKSIMKQPYMPLNKFDISTNTM
jgi:hypothetical protein